MYHRIGAKLFTNLAGTWLITSATTLQLIREVKTMLLHRRLEDSATISYYDESTVTEIYSMYTLLKQELILNNLGEKI